MNKKFLYGLVALTSASLCSCEDKDPKGFDDSSIDREFMTMFRVNSNTNRGDDDIYGCQTVAGPNNTFNSIYLAWYGVTGAAAYQIQMGDATCWAERWEEPEHVLLDTIVGPEVLNLTLDYLQYDYNYKFAIRTLSVKGQNPDGSFDLTSKYHSKWYGHGDQRHNTDYLGIPTNPRYEVPEVLQISDRTDNSFRVNFDFGFPSGSSETFEQFERDENGNFVAQILSVTPSSTNPDAQIDEQWKWYRLTPTDLANGYVDITGLSKNSSYVVDIINENVPHAVDRGYNMVAPRTTGDVGDPIFIECIYDNDTIPAAHEYKCARIDTIITNFNKSSELAEGTIFELEGGKNYYIETNTDVQKGFVLRTRPEDVKKGLRATVFLGGIHMNSANTDVQTCNWNFGKVASAGESSTPIMMCDIVFENIDFRSPLAKRFDVASNKTGSGNYFGNCNANSVPLTMNSLQLKNCSFQDISRGFTRVQGSTRKTIDKILIENCVMWNCGFYDNGGGGYNWIHGNEAANVRSNPFRNVIFRGNTFVDSPKGALVHDKDKANNWPSSVQWCFTIENNTFLNFNTRKNSNNLIKLRYVPGATEFHIHNNLFIQAKDADDNRAMHLALVDVRTINSDPLSEITIDVNGNYGCTWDAANQKDDGTPTTAKFSDTKNSFGRYTVENGFIPGVTSGSQLKVLCGSTPLLPTELMRAPNPPHHDPDPKMHQRESLDGLFYNHTEKVTNHEIYKLGIGDTRWRDASDMKSFWMLKSEE